jgi:hypothetical protein
MTFEEAIRRSIEYYFKGVEPETLHKSGKGRVKYTKKYFDRFEKDKFSGPTISELMEKREI